MLKETSVGLAIVASAGALLTSSPASAQMIPASTQANVAYVQTAGTSMGSSWGDPWVPHCRIHHHRFHRFACFHHRFRHFHRFDGFHGNRNFDFHENRSFNFNRNADFGAIRTVISNTNINTNLAR
ncbi:hypothetical protein [Nonomuraea sp. NPDC049695]|uniref:hypothetical protein n=1 Tax=Nonomuraea sp. NPDC049695 TaxID=3154734 RepID=UPI003417552D